MGGGEERGERGEGRGTRLAQRSKRSFSSSRRAKRCFSFSATMRRCAYHLPHPRRFIQGCLLPTSSERSGGGGGGGCGRRRRERTEALASSNGRSEERELLREGLGLRGPRGRDVRPASRLHHRRHPRSTRPAFHPSRVANAGVSSSGPRPQNRDWAAPALKPLLSPKEEAMLAFDGVRSFTSVVPSTCVGKCVMETMGLACLYCVGLGSLTEFQDFAK